MAEEKKKKKGLRPHLNDYVQDVNGEYIYKGTYHVCALPAEVFRGQSRLLLTVFVLAFVLLVAAGCLSTGTASGAFYVTVPYAVAVVLTFICIYDSFTVWRSGGKMRTHDHDRVVPRMRGCAVVGTAFAAAAAVGQGVYLLAFGEETTRGADIVYLLCVLLAALLDFFAFRRQRKILWNLQQIV